MPKVPLFSTSCGGCFSRPFFEQNAPRGQKVLKVICRYALFFQPYLANSSSRVSVCTVEYIEPGSTYPHLFAEIGRASCIMLNQRNTPRCCVVSAFENLGTDEKPYKGKGVPYPNCFTVCSVSGVSWRGRLTASNDCAVYLLPVRMLAMPTLLRDGS